MSNGELFGFANSNINKKCCHLKFCKNKIAQKFEFYAIKDSRPWNVPLYFIFIIELLLGDKQQQQQQYKYKLHI